MIRTTIWYILGWCYLFTTLPLICRVKYLEWKGRLTEKDRFANKITATIAKVLFSLTGSTVSVTGKENLPENQAVLFASNHQSHVDSAVIRGYIDVPTGFIADKGAGQIPILRTWMKFMKCVFIDRENIRHNISSMQEVINTLKSGHSMVIYPEGKLDEGKLLGEFKNGYSRLAMKAGVPIVPVTIIGSYRVMSREGLKIRPATVRCIISEPIQVPRYSREDEEILTLKIRNIMEANLKEDESL